MTGAIFNDFFNITLTYRSSADISRPYGAVFHKNMLKAVEPSEWLAPPKIDNNIIKLSDYGLTDFKSRTKDISWIVL